jgi:uncharacterized protein YbaP (TraB family)
LHRAEILAFESNFKAGVDRRLLAANKGEDSLSLFQEELYAALRRSWLEQGLNARSLDVLSPMMVADALARSRYAAQGYVWELGVDERVWALAGTTKAQRYFLDPAAAPLKLCANAPRSEAVRAIEKVVNDFEAALNEDKELIVAWNTSDEKLALRVLHQYLTDAPVTASLLLAGRNRTWIPHLVSLARGRRPAVATVGILHLVGEAGIPSLLALAGYSCKLV